MQHIIGGGRIGRAKSRSDKKVQRTEDWESAFVESSQSYSDINFYYFDNA